MQHVVLIESQGDHQQIAAWVPTTVDIALTASDEELRARSNSRSPRSPSPSSRSSTSSSSRLLSWLPPSPSPPPQAPGSHDRNLFGEAERIAARAATASTRRQYAAIFRAFGDWLAGELRRPPVIGDFDADVIAAYGRHLATSGGRGGRPAAPATVRVYLSMIRALARDLGLDDAVEDVRCPDTSPDRRRR
jgi:hypothetical protein